MNIQYVISLVFLSVCRSCYKIKSFINTGYLPCRCRCPNVQIWFDALLYLDVVNLVWINILSICVGTRRSRFLSRRAGSWYWTYVCTKRDPGGHSRESSHPGVYSPVSFLLLFKEILLKKIFCMNSKLI